MSVHVLQSQPVCVASGCVVCVSIYVLAHSCIVVWTPDSTVELCASDALRLSSSVLWFEKEL